MMTGTEIALCKKFSPPKEWSEQDHILTGACLHVVCSFDGRDVVGLCFTSKLQPKIKKFPAQELVQALKRPQNSKKQHPQEIPQLFGIILHTIHAHASLY